MPVLPIEALEGNQGRKGSLFLVPVCSQHVPAVYSDQQCAGHPVVPPPVSVRGTTSEDGFHGALRCRGGDPASCTGPLLSLPKAKPNMHQP